MADAEGPAKKSDLGLRTVSAVIMVLVAGSALWLGGRAWTAFVAVVALGVLWEWRGLVTGFEASAVRRGLWNAGGIVYVGLAATMLALIRTNDIRGVAMLVLAVIGTDVGAYFAGRTFGGPKIAPRISPSKTWSGLGGGIIGASVALACFLVPTGDQGLMALFSLLGGALVAIVAQSGDFFESWMKRRAGVKDSSHLIPGHGGLFDRADGLLAVSFVIALVMLATVGATLLSGGSLLPSPQ